MASSTQHALQRAVNLYSETLKTRCPKPSTTQLYWWQYAVRNVCRTSDDPHAVKTALRLFPTPDDTAALLSRREKVWLNNCLQVICEVAAIKVPLCDTPESTAQKIVEIVTWIPPLPRWNTDWILEALKGDTGITTIKEKFDSQLLDMVSGTTIPDWAAWRFGYSNNGTNFLYTMIQIRDSLILYAQSHGTAKLESLLQASSQPMSRWILSTAISGDISSRPEQSIRFVIDPINQIFAENGPFQMLIQHLLILETRFRKFVTLSHVTWPAPFPTNFSLCNSINTLPPSILAESITKAVDKLFLRVRFERIYGNAREVKDVGENWTAFYDDMLACLNAGVGIDYVKELVDVFLSSSPRNIHTATAIGLALKTWGFQSCAWAAWDIINPDDNFAGCVKLMNQGNCYPYLNRIAKEAQKLLAANDRLLEEDEGNARRQDTKQGIRKRMLEIEEIIDPARRKRRDTKQGIVERIQEVEENTEVVHFEMGAQQNTSRGISRIIQIQSSSPSSATDQHVVSSTQNSSKGKVLVDNESPHLGNDTNQFALDSLTLRRDKHLADSLLSTNVSLHATGFEVQPPNPMSSQASASSATTAENSRFSPCDIKNLLNETPHLASGFKSPPPNPEMSSQASASSAMTAKNSKSRRETCQRSGINSSLERSTPSPEKERMEVSDLLDDIEITYWRANDTTARRILERCGDDIEEGDFGPYLGEAGHMTQDFRPEPAAPPASTSRPPTPDFLASREGSCSEVRSQEHQVGEQGNLSPTIQKNSNHAEQPPPSGSAITPSKAQCLALTDDQCRMIQALVDPKGVRQQKDWETRSQLRLIRLYMTGYSFPMMESKMMPELDYSYKTYRNRLHDWFFPTEFTERRNKINQLYALVSELTPSTGLNSQIDFSAYPDLNAPTEHPVSECQRPTVPSQASQNRTTEAHPVAEDSPMMRGATASQACTSKQPQQLFSNTSIS